MFTRSTSVASRKPPLDSRDKGIATLRIYNRVDEPFGRIYEEAVLGAYKPVTGSDPTVVTHAPGGKSPQLFSLSPKTRYVRHLGSTPHNLKALFEETEPGSSFFIRDRKMLRFTNEQVKSAVFSNPIWIAEQQEGPRPTSVAPPIPSGAKMGRHSLFSDAAGDVAAILVPEETMPLFDMPIRQAAKSRSRI
jgi:hypothetical protein